jgi:hypothetical protein
LNELNEGGQRTGATADEGYQVGRLIRDWESLFHSLAFEGEDRNVTVPAKLTNTFLAWSRLPCIRIHYSDWPAVVLRAQ